MQCARALSAASGARTFITSGARRVTMVVGWKARRPSVAVVGTVTARSEGQQPKAYSPIHVIDAGIETHSSEVQPPNALSAIAVTDGGMTTWRSAEQW